MSDSSWPSTVEVDTHMDVSQVRAQLEAMQALFETLRDAYATSADRCRDALARLSSDAEDEPVPSDEGGEDR